MNALRIALAHNVKRIDVALAGAAVVESEAELDTPETIAFLVDALASLGHDVVPVDVDVPLPALVDALIGGPRPIDVVFNIAEGRAGRFREAFYPALFEQLGLAFTGSDAGTLALCADKARTKRLLRRACGRCDGVGDALALGFFADDVRSIDDGLARLARVHDGTVIVKPNFEGSSKGIDGSAVCETHQRARERALEVLARYPDGVLVEEYVDGADVSVSWLEGTGALPPASFTWPTASARAHDVLDLALKTTHASDVVAQVPAPLDDAIVDELRGCTEHAMRVLGVRGLGRADFRVAPNGRVVFLELNPLPSLAPGDDEVWRAAALTGFATPADVLARIVEGATRRPAWRRAPCASPPGAPSSACR